METPQDTAGTESPGQPQEITCSGAVKLPRALRPAQPESEAGDGE